jgi:hypothetical protein
MIIGLITKKEDRPIVVIEKDFKQYIASKAKLARLNSLVQTESQTHQ